MIDMRCIIRFDSARVQRLADRENIRSIGRASAYIRGVARRMVKVRRKGNINSKPGEAPIAHSRVFKNSIVFGLERSNGTAVIGPARLLTTRTNNFGQPVPDILEHGGPVASGPNVHWPYGRRNQPNGNTYDDVVSFIMQRGYGPIRYGLSSSALISQAKNANGRGSYGKLVRGGKRGQYKTWQRYSPVKGKKVYLQNARIYTEAQAVKCADLIIELFGYPHTQPGNVAPRPLMGPALETARPQIAEFWRGAINAA